MCSSENAVGHTDLFAARPARVLVAVARILEFWPALEELQYQLVWASPHSERIAACDGGSRRFRILPGR